MRVGECMCACGCMGGGDMVHGCGCEGGQDGNSDHTWAEYIVILFILQRISVNQYFSIWQYLWYRYACLLLRSVVCFLAFFLLLLLLFFFSFFFFSFLFLLFKFRLVLLVGWLVSRLFCFACSFKWNKEVLDFTWLIKTADYRQA